MQKNKECNKCREARRQKKELKNLPASIQKQLKEAEAEKEYWPDPPHQ